MFFIPHLFPEGRMSVQLIVEKNFSLRVHSPCIEQVTTSISNSLRFSFFCCLGFRKRLILHKLRVYLQSLPQSYLYLHLGRGLVRITLWTWVQVTFCNASLLGDPSYQMMVNKAEPLISIWLWIFISTGQNSEARRKELLAPLY